MVSDLVKIMAEVKENQTVNYDEFKLIIKEKISDTCLIVDFIYNSEEFFDTLPSLLLSYVEIGSQAHIALFPLEEN